MIQTKLFLLILIANGAPIVGWYLLREKLNRPLDGGHCLPDGKPIFGESKTVRGIIFSLALTAIAAPFLGILPTIGLVIAFFAMLGDISTSFIKRRLGMPSSSMALGFDQIPEALFPLLAVQGYFNLSFTDILAVVFAFMLTGVVFSKLLFHLGIRKRPY